jgi:hypothetical protein
MTFRDLCQRRKKMMNCFQFSCFLSVYWVENIVGCFMSVHCWWRKGDNLQCPSASHDYFCAICYGLNWKLKSVCWMNTIIPLWPLPSCHYLFEFEAPFWMSSGYMLLCLNVNVAVTSCAQELNLCYFLNLSCVMSLVLDLLI